VVQDPETRDEIETTRLHGEMHDVCLDEEGLSVRVISGGDFHGGTRVDR
jgi:hypothetical protein